MSQPIPAATPADNAREAKRVTLIGAVLDALLGIAKIIIGVLANSHALVADGIHSLSDLVTDVMVIAVVQVSHQEPDKEHPYGHERFETLGTVVLGCLLVAVAGALAYDSVVTLIAGGGLATPGWPALVVVIISLVSKEWIFRYTLATGKRLKSDLLIANAWHSRTDAYSSLVVLVGILGAMAGLPWLDSLAALGVALFVAKIGWELTSKSLRELVDTAIPADEQAAIKATALSVEGVRSVHSFRSRQMGAKRLLEMHLQVPPYVSTSEGHYIGDCVVERLLNEHEDIGHVIFHVDTEDDGDATYCTLLPTRSEVSAAVNQSLAAIAPETEMRRLTLHYLDEGVDIELFVDSLPAQSSVALQKELNTRLAQYNWFRRLRLWQGNQS